MPPSSSSTTRRAGSLRDRDPADPLRRAVELVQRGRMILDVAAVDLEVAERRLGPFHETAWYFRNALHEARNSWDRLRAELGGKTMEQALDYPPVTLLTLGDAEPGGPRAILIPIRGQTYGVERVPGTPAAPVQWRLNRVNPPLEDGPYYLCRLDDGSTQCDCAEWAYRDESTRAATCKHLAALAALGWV